MGTVIFLLIAGFIITFLFFFQKKQQKKQLEKQQIQSQFAQTLLQCQLEIQEQTLNHISRELHDNLGQVASLIKINLNTLSLNDMEKATAKIEDTREITRQMITDIRALSVILGADRIDQTGLAIALETEVERINKSDAFEASFSQQGSISELNPDISVILYRMAQEILHNIVKHSGAKHLSVLLQELENLFILEFNHNGAGFDVNTKKHTSGAGLLNLEHRARMINAKIHIEGAAGKGTRVRIELPL